VTIPPDPSELEKYTRAIKERYGNSNFMDQIRRKTAMYRAKQWDKEVIEKERVYDLQTEITARSAEDAITYVREFYNPGAEEFTKDPDLSSYRQRAEITAGSAGGGGIIFVRKPLSKFRVPDGLGAKAQANKLKSIIEFAEASSFRLKNITVKEQATRANESVFVGQGLAYNKQMELDTSPDSNQMTIYLEGANATQFKRAEIVLEFENVSNIDYPLAIPNNALQNAIDNKIVNNFVVGELSKYTKDSIRSYDYEYSFANVGLAVNKYMDEKRIDYRIPKDVTQDKQIQNVQVREKIGKLTEFKEKVSGAVSTKYNALQEVIGSLSPEERKSMSRTAVLRMLGYGVQMGYSFLNSEYVRSPEIIFGPVLLYSVQMVERAKSDRKLKNRALGDVFLAHQKGNRDICRIDGTLFGPQRYVMLALLVKLQKDGEGFVTNLSNKSGIVFETMAPPAQGEIQKSTKQHFNYEEHKTMPLVTRTHVMLNMYLQTIEWHRSIEDGIDVIKYHLLFRKHVPSTAWRAFNPQKYTNDEGKPLAGAGYQLLDSRAQVKRWLEYSLDLAWKVARTFGEAYLHMMIDNDGSREVDINKNYESIPHVLTAYQGNLFGVF